nr:MAG TPA: hypothetical protein [Caudoviricetes sp.]
MGMAIQCMSSLSRMATYTTALIPPLQLISWDSMYSIVQIKPAHSRINKYTVSFSISLLLFLIYEYFSHLLVKKFLQLSLRKAQPMLLLFLSQPLIYLFPTHYKFVKILPIFQHFEPVSNFFVLLIL